MKRSVQCYFCFATKKSNKLKIDVAVTDNSSRLNANDGPYADDVPAAPKPKR